MAKRQISATIGIEPIAYSIYRLIHIFVIFDFSQQYMNSSVVCRIAKNALYVNTVLHIEEGLHLHTSVQVMT
jgi:hypothetical protein